jgi:hypothetical protein
VLGHVAFVERTPKVKTFRGVERGKYVDTSCPRKRFSGNVQVLHVARCDAYADGFLAAEDLERRHKVGVGMAELAYQFTSDGELAPDDRQIRVVEKEILNPAAGTEAEDAIYLKTQPTTRALQLRIGGPIGRRLRCWRYRSRWSGFKRPVRPLERVTEDASHLVFENRCDFTVDYLFEVLLLVDREQLFLREQLPAVWTVHLVL